MNIRNAVTIVALTSAFVANRTLSAQEIQVGQDSSTRWSVLVPSGTIIPTGEQRHAIKRGNVTAIQLAYALRPAFAITSTRSGWARSRDIATSGSPKLDVFTYDVGAEARAPRWAQAAGMTFSPFAGVGAGGP